MSEIPWTAAHHAQLRSLYPDTPTRKIAAVMGRSYESVKSRASKLKLKKQYVREWLRREDRLLRSLYPDMPTAEIANRLGRSKASAEARARNLGLRKSPAYISNMCRLQLGQKIGERYCFPKGHVPANKGLRRPGYAPGRMAQTQFKKGQTPHNTFPLWSFRVNTDGYLLLKTGAVAPKPNNGWEWVHKLVWEQANGAIPRGHRIWWKDGDRLNCSLGNLELLSGAEHMARTTIHNLPPNLKEVLAWSGALKRRIRRIEREEQDLRSA
jgi:HNH endonuclease